MDKNSVTKTKTANGSRRKLLSRLVPMSTQLTSDSRDLLQSHDENAAVSLFIAGTGAVGSTLIDLLNERSCIPPLKVIGVCNTSHWSWDRAGMDPKGFLNEPDIRRQTDWDAILKQLVSLEGPLIFIDATGSEEVARLYPQILNNGIHIVTPSKLANTFEQAFFNELQEKSHQNRASFRYETTVGAGLPVISTIQNLQISNDRVKEVSGVVSGTMTYLFNRLQDGVAFSEAIREARDRGYAEPDPRDDLSGEDVARKFLTLARTMGLKMERDELEVESLVPRELLKVDRTTFLKRLADYDRDWQEKMLSARERNETLRYTGQLSGGKITIGIRSVPLDSPLGQLRGTDNLIQIFSAYYHNTPLVIQGPGAGKQVTAAGVLSDILKTARHIY